MSRVYSKEDITGMLDSPEDLYAAIEDHRFNDWSDGSKSGFFNYLATERGNEHELEMWNLQNAYNDPSSQVQRLLKAGLNPSLFYQSVNNGNASSSPGTHVPNFSFSNKKEKLQKTEMILQAVQSFASEIMNMVNVGTQLYDYYHYTKPTHAAESSIAANQAYFQNERMTGLRSLEVIPASSIGEGMPHQTTEGLDYLGNINGQDMYLYSPNKQYYSDVIHNLQKAYRLGSNESYMVDYRKHMRNMFESEESLKAAQSLIQNYIADFEGSVPREFRWMIPLLIQMFTKF